MNDITRLAMRTVVRDLRLCDKGIEVWLDNKLHVVGMRETQLAAFYGLRDGFLKELKTYQEMPVNEMAACGCCEYGS